MNSSPLILLALLFFVFFTGLEVAFVSSSKLRFELDKKQRNLTSSILSVFYQHPERFISTMLVGNVISLVAYVMGMAQAMGIWLNWVENLFIALLIQIVLAALLLLVVGEILPRLAFRIKPNLWMRLFSWLLMLFYVVLYPVTSLCTRLSVGLLKLFKVGVEPLVLNRLFLHADVNYLIQEVFEKKDGDVEMENEVKIFQNALDFSKVKLRDCFVPRTEIIALDYDTRVETLMQTFIETGLSKIPIYKGDIDNIIGYIHSSVMFEHQKDWKRQIIQIPIVPETMAAQKLMKMLMHQKKSIAVVVDEFGGTTGIVTLEDIMEEIFGEIEDEYDNRDYLAKKVAGNEYLLSGRLEVKAANAKFNLNIEESDDYETIAGFILYNHQHFPKLNEVIRIGGFTLKCIKVTNNRIELVKLTTPDKL